MKTITLTDEQFDTLYEYVNDKVTTIVDASVDYQDSEILMSGKTCQMFTHYQRKSMSKIRSEFPQTPINLTLREEQISTILYCLEGYVQGNDDEELVDEVDEIFEVLEKTVDKFYAKIEKAKAKQPTMEWD